MFLSLHVSIPASPPPNSVGDSVELMEGCVGGTVGRWGGVL